MSDVKPCPNDEILDRLVQYLTAVGHWVQAEAVTELREEYAGLVHDFDRQLDCALIQANATAEYKGWDRFVVEGWMPSLLKLKEAITQNPLFPDHGEEG